jgi:hypothetical protein
MFRCLPVRRKSAFRGTVECRLTMQKRARFSVRHFGLLALATIAAPVAFAFLLIFGTRLVQAIVSIWTPYIDPKIAAIHLLSLLESELLQRVLLGVIDTVKPESLSGAVRRAVDVFLFGYERR